MLDTEKIRRDLRDLWDSLGREHEGGVLRACALTLVVVAKDEADAEAARQTLGIVMHQHPSRAFVVRMTRENKQAEARVFAECWMPFGGHQQICAEGIEISASTAQLAEVARVLSALRAADLPCVVWVRGAQEFEDSSMAPVFDLADKVIFDSAAADAGESVKHLKDLRRQGRHVADLAWTRLTCWRETLSHLVEDGLLDPNAIRRIRLSHGGAQPNSSVHYFAAWLRYALPSVEVAIEAGSGSAELRSVVLEGPGVEVSITLHDRTSLDVRAGTRHDYAPLPCVTEDALIGQELNLLRKDSVFDKVLGE